MSPRKTPKPRKPRHRQGPKRLTQSLGVLLAAAFAAAGLGGIVATTDSPADPDTTPTASPSASVSRETFPEPTVEPTPEQTPTVAPEEQVSLPPVTEGVPVTRVVDGDTIRVMTDGQEVQVRMIGMDTPETVHPREPVQCYGPEASAEAKRILTDSHVTLIQDPTQGNEEGKDYWGRSLAYVEVDGMDFAEHMIRTGHAREYTYRGSEYQRAGAYRAAEDAAQAEGLGLWDPAGCNGSR